MTENGPLSATEQYSASLGLRSRVQRYHRLRSYKWNIHLMWLFYWKRFTESRKNRGKKFQTTQFKILSCESTGGNLGNDWPQARDEIVAWPSTHLPPMSRFPALEIEHQNSGQQAELLRWFGASMYSRHTNCSCCCSCWHGCAHCQVHTRFIHSRNPLMDFTYISSASATCF